MEERKTAAIVLSIIAVAVIFFTAILPEIRYRSTQTLSFGNCKVHFNYSGPGIASDVYRTSQNKLALCLCNSYHQHCDTAVGSHILQIYRNYGDHSNYDSLRTVSNIDTIIKYKKVVFDTLVLID